MTSVRMRFQALLSEFKNAMLVTRTADGMLRARPMSVARTEEHGDLWFIMALDSDAMQEISTDTHAAATFQSGSKYVCVSGRIEVIWDRHEIQALWKETFRPWFPKGKEDPRLAVVRLDAEQAEYWDRSGIQGVTYLFEAAKAVITRERLEESSPKLHAKVRL